MSNNFGLGMAGGREVEATQDAVTQASLSTCLCAVQRKVVKVGEAEDGTELWSEDDGKTWYTFHEGAVGCFRAMSGMIQAAFASGMQRSELYGLANHDDLTAYVCGKVTEYGLQYAAGNDDAFLQEMRDFLASQ